MFLGRMETEYWPEIDKEDIFHSFRLKKHPRALYPRHWPPSVAQGSKIDLSSEVFERVKEDFQESIKKSVKIVSIKEVCNYDFFDRYERIEYFFLKVAIKGKRRLSYSELRLCFSYLIWKITAKTILT